ncbi:MAG: HD domain-containing protein [Alphaproteobacteria bacterium]|nr:HD domain-containing protein [Alphaproteobacteria bacterium]
MELRAYPARFVPPPQPGLTIPKVDLVLALGRAIELLDADLSAQQKRVALIAANIVGAMGLGRAEIARTIMAALLHGVGALAPAPHGNSTAVSARFLEISPLTRDLAPIVAASRDFQPAIGMRLGLTLNDALLAQALHLAHHVDEAIDPARFVLAQAAERRNGALEFTRTGLDARLVDAFARTSHADSFWLDATNFDIDTRIRARLSHMANAQADLDAVQDFARLYSVLVDARSPYTATHSWGVAAVANFIASCSRFDGETVQQIEIAAQLHDIGKLVVPSQIIEKPANLTVEEFGTVRSHAYFTGTLLSSVPGLERIAEWAKGHHEKLDGTGYPMGLAGARISPETRVIAVADQFVALTEDRPYRAGLSGQRALEMLGEAAERGAIDRQIVAIVHEKFATVDAIRRHAQNVERDEIKTILRAH